MTGNCLSRPSTSRIAVRKAEIHEHDIGPRLGTDGHRLPDAAGRADHAHLRVLGEQRGQSLSHQSMVVDHQHRDRARLVRHAVRLRARP